MLAERNKKLKEGTERNDLKDFSLDQNGWLRKKGRLCVMNVGDIRKEILEECHRS